MILCYINVSCMMLYRYVMNDAILYRYVMDDAM